MKDDSIRTDCKPITKDIPNYMNQFGKYTIILFSLVIAIGIGWCWAVYDLFAHWNDYKTIPVESASAIFSLRWTVFILGIVVVAFVIRLIRHGKIVQIQNSPSNWFVIRAAFYCFLVPFVATSILHTSALNVFEGNGFLMRSFFYSTLLLCLTVWILWVFLRHWQVCASTRIKILKAIDIICVNLLILLLLGETSLSVFNYVKPSMLFYSSSSDIVTRLNSIRMKPHSPYFNFRLNSEGYHDEEFFHAKASDLVIGLLADSFGFGVVPYEYNFATIAERELQRRFRSSYRRIAIHNFGIPAIAMEEYAYLLETEVLQTNPSMVLLCIFVGNDIIESQEFGQINPSRYCLQNWFLWLLPKRLFILAKEKIGATGRQKNRFEIGQLNEQGRVPAYVYDSSRERPTYSEDKFLEIERWRFFESCNPNYYNCRKGFKGLFNGLDYFQKRLGTRLIVVILPDEFQVNDKLYKKIIAENPLYVFFQRDYPQKRILTYCKENGINCVDMLQALRKGQKIGRTYHLQDTHLNAHGNRIVGKALAEAIGVYINNSDPQR